MPPPRTPGVRAWKDLMNCTPDPAAPVVLYNPASFDPETALPARLRRFAPYARWFVHAIYTRRVFDRRGDTDFIPLHAAHLRRVLPQDYYREIIDALVAAGAVETDRHYVKGEKSMGYRLAGVLQGERHTRHVVGHRMLAKKLKGRREDRAARLTLDVHRHLWRHLRALEIDFPDVMRDQPRLAVPGDAAILELCGHLDRRPKRRRWSERRGGRSGPVRVPASNPVPGSPWFRLVSQRVPARCQPGSRWC